MAEGYGLYGFLLVFALVDDFFDVLCRIIVESFIAESFTIS
jgi:hypothetical protein